MTKISDGDPKYADLRGGGFRRCLMILKTLCRSILTPLGFLWFCLFTQAQRSRRERGDKEKYIIKECILFKQLPMQVVILYCALIHMLGWLFVPEPCGGKVAVSTGRHQVLCTKNNSEEVKLEGVLRLKADVSIYIRLQCLCCRGKYMQPAQVALMQRCVNRVSLGGSCGSWRDVRGSCWVSVKWLLCSTQEIK